MLREERSEMVAQRLRSIWEENYVKNRQFMLSPDGDFETFKAILGTRCRNKGAAMVVGAGPSWKKNIMDLDPSLYVIVACDKMVPRLVEQGIIPEIVVALNAEPTDVKKWIDPIKNERKTTLVMPAGVHPNTYDDWAGHIFWVNAMVPTGLHKRVERETRLTPMVIGSNAGTFAYMIASAIGYNPIGYMGLDFSFLTREEVMRKYMIGQDTVGEISIASDKIIITSKESMPIYAKQYNIIEMTDVNGDVRWLDIGWFDMAVAFQEHVKRAEQWYDTKTFNCTEGGINISRYSEETTIKEFNRMLRGKEDEIP